jgi:hypothetical protein
MIISIFDKKINVRQTVVSRCFWHIISKINASLTSKTRIKKHFSLTVTPFILPAVSYFGQEKDGQFYIVSVQNWDWEKQVPPCKHNPTEVRDAVIRLASSVGSGP